MTRVYTKDDVQFHADNWGPMLPAVNVKTQPWDWDKPEAIGAARDYDSSLDPRFEDWYLARGNEQEGSPYTFLDSYWEFACEAGWEDLQQEAEHYFGEGVKVESQGRSGGWAVVKGLPDFESWDAVDLGKWRGFERSAKILAAGIPEQMSILASINAFEAWLDTQPSLVTIGLVLEGAGL